MPTIVKDKISKSDGSHIPIIKNIHEGHRMLLLCLHGFAGDKESSVIAALMENLEEKGIGVMTFDWPLHEESDAADGALTVERCLEDLDLVLAYLKQTSQLPISCFATSFGGYLATLYRNKHTDVFESLVLRSPALKMGSVFWGLMTDVERSRLLHGNTITMEFDRKMTIGNEFYDSLCRNDAFIQSPPRPSQIMIIQGDKDPVVNPADTVSYAKKHGIKLVIFEGSDHVYKKLGEKERIVTYATQFLLGNLRFSS